MDQKRKIKVIAVDDKDIADMTIEFEEDWFFEGETIYDSDDSDHDIKLVKELSRTKFNFVGTAKVGEYYSLYRK